MRRRNPYFRDRGDDGLLRGVYHRARNSATRWPAMTNKLSADFISLSCFTGRFAARGKPRQHEVDHLVERRPRLVGALRDYLRMKKPYHRRTGAHRRYRHIRHLEFA